VKFMRIFQQTGFTLIEVVLIIVIIGIMTTVAMKSLQPNIEAARETATMEEMESLEMAIIGDKNLVEGGIRSDYGYVGDVGSLPGSLDDLVTSPSGYTTWHGPYIRSDFNEDAEDFKRDAWNQLYTYTGGVAIASAGGSAPLTRQFASSASELTANTVTGNIYDGLGNPPGDSAASVTLAISYPDGSGGMTSSSTSPTASGGFSFANIIPIGNHNIWGIYSPAGETTSAYISVPPSTKLYCELRFNGGFWSPGGPGPGGGSVEYVSGSAYAYGAGSNNNNLEFQIVNTSATDPATINSLTATYTASPVSYYGEITWDGTIIWSNGTHNGSGDIAGFSDQNINAGQTVTIQLVDFRQNQGGSGLKIDVNGVSFIISFSNGDTINFMVP